MTSTGSPNIIIRSPTQDDIAKLAANIIPEVTVERLQRRWQEHQDGSRDMLIAELDGEVVGTVSTTGCRNQQPNSLRLLALDVGPKFRRRGIGTALMEAPEKLARERGLQSVNLEVGVANTDAIRLYERRGYERLGNPEIVAGELSWIMIKPV